MSLAAWGILVLLLYAMYRWRASASIPKGTKELPGPKVSVDNPLTSLHQGYPILGNLLEFPRTHAWMKFKEWGDIYGPIYKINILGTTNIIISQQSIADELLAARGATYSDRGQLCMVTLVTGGGDLLASPLNDYWRRGRKFAAAVTNATMASQWQSLQAQEARRMVVDMAKDPEKYQFWFERVSTSVSVRAGFGKSLREDAETEYHTNKIISRMHNIERVAAPGAYLVDMIPSLMHVPEFLAPFKKEAKKLYEDESAYFFGLLEEARKKHEAGITESPPSFARCWLEKEDQWELAFHEAGYVIGTLYGGGAGTTSFAMQSYCLAMCHFPEWQTKLQEELDKVVGPSRVPAFEDLPTLHVVRAVIKEILRWRPVVPTNLPHRLTKDDTYQGYHLPKGALVFGNQWAIHREEALYPDPENFNPDRWLQPGYPTFEEPLEQYPNIKRFSAFGFGRRICPGYEMAERALFIQVSSLAWACHIRKKVVNGVEIPVPWYDYTNGSNSAPKPFAFDVKPRDGHRIEMMHDSWRQDRD